MPVESTSKPTHPNAVYPWAKWRDGKPRWIRKGKDFTCSPVSMRKQIWNYACRNGLKAETSIDFDRNRVWFQLGGK